MKQPSILFWIGILFIGFLSVSPARAETIELVTYYPAPGGGNVQTDRLRASRGTVGDAYSLTNPADAVLTEGTLLVADRLGIGPVFGTTPPAGALHVVGADDTLDRVLFMPGADTPAAGRPDIRVGIGTQNPQAMLDIQHPQDAAYVRVMGTGDATNFSGLELRSDETVDKIWQIVHKQAAGLNDLHVNYFDGAAWSTKMAIQPGGNVGIGTTTPAAQLDIEANTNGTQQAIQLRNASAGANAYTEMEFGNDAAASALAIGVGSSANTTYPNTAYVVNRRNGPLTFHTNNTEKMRITAAGDVGIGTTAPLQALDVAGGIRFSKPGQNNGGWLLAQSPGGIGGGKQALLTVSDGLSDNRDEVWIGPNAAGHGAKGYVQLWAYQIYMTAPGGAFLNGNSLGASDLRLKTEVTPLPSVLRDVCALRGVKFRWVDPARYGSGMQLGLIGNEVNRVFPELVREDAKGFKYVDYSHLTAVLVEAVKELKAENDQLKQKVEADHQEIQTLKEALAGS